MDSLQEIEDERNFREEEEGIQNHDDLYWLCLLMKEVGELAENIVGIGEGSVVGARQELVQVTAVGLAWLECMERRRMEELEA